MKIEISLNWLIIPLIAIGALLLSRHFMSTASWLWYLRIKLPPITPPVWLIKRMWQIIYLLTPLCALIVYNFFTRDMRFWTIVSLFAVNVTANVYWTYLLFSQHLIGSAALCVAVLTCSVWALIALIWPISPLTGALLLPYGLWGILATVFNTWLWLIN